MSLYNLFSREVHHNMAGHDMPDHNMPGHDMPGHKMPMCKMNMLFTWDYENVCVVFKWWHIYNKLHLVLSILAIVGLAAGYEILKYRYKVFARQNSTVKGLPVTNNVYQNLSPRKIKVKLALYYGLQVGYSFMLMLIFMSFNGWLMLAVVIGATLGHFLWNDLPNSQVYVENGNASQESLEGEPLACH